MDIVTKIADVRHRVRQARDRGKTVGLVPTMGALHEGHGSLIRRAVAECGFTVVSIFVNPTQFGPQEDLEAYPRTFEADAEYCRSLKADLIFAPSAADMYPEQQFVWVDVEELTSGLCGASRPGHFRGVTTVCAKLFNIVGPDIAFFGQKDAQQAVVIKRMVRDLNMPLKIRICPIVREPDGLAMSSRNQYLTDEDRKKAVCLFQALQAAQQMIQAGQRDCKPVIQTMKNLISGISGTCIDYVEIVDPDTLKPLETIENKALIALSVQIGNTRLIDNLVIDLNAV